MSWQLSAYSDFMVEGETVFSGITDHQGTAFRYFFLKHYVLHDVVTSGGAIKFQINWTEDTSTNG